jgi:hypothetical protein
LQCGHSQSFVSNEVVAFCDLGELNMRYPFLLNIIFVSIAANASGPTPTVGIDHEQITVSGVSSGAQMAHQLHIAYPEIFSGAAMIAGGPFGCAGGDLATAFSRCMGSVNGELPLEQFVQEINEASLQGRLGKTAALSDDDVWVFHGKLDKTVAAELSDATVDLYGHYIPAENIRYVKDVEAAHTFPTRGEGNACTSTEAPFIGDCDYDAAGELLQHLYAGLESPAVEFDAGLAETALPGAGAAGMAESAYLYIPKACSKAGSACKTHLVLHGCAQSASQLGTAFIEQSGYLSWAASNNIVLLFPQVVSTAVNPLACWDWWGYTGEDYRWRDSIQMSVIVQWIETLASP